MRILILGGTGFLGPHEIPYAVARGHAVTVFNRGNQPAPAGVEQLTGDRDKGDLASLAGRRWDVCIDNAAYVPFQVRDAARMLASQVDHYLFVSTISTYADHGAAEGDAAADEDAPLGRYAGDALAATRQTLNDDLALYGPLKVACEEEAVRGFGADRTTIVRPALIVGPGDLTDRFTYWPARVANLDGQWGDEVVAPGDGGEPIQWIDVRDLTEWLIRLAERPIAGIFNASGPERPTTVAAFLADIAAGVGRAPKLRWLPKLFLDANNVAPWSDLPVWMPAEGAMAGFHRRNLVRALAAGLTLRPLADTAADTAAWFATLPRERRAKLQAGLSPEREAQLLAAADS
jgi:2'-hydroxyisoflavone reductase